LDGLRKQKESEQGQVKEQRNVEGIKAEYDEKIKALDLRRDKLEDEIDDSYDKFTRDNDNYEDQLDLLKYIKWVEGEV
jgi:malate synthase